MHSCHRLVCSQLLPKTPAAPKAGRRMLRSWGCCAFSCWQLPCCFDWGNFCFFSAFPALLPFLAAVQMLLLILWLLLLILLLLLRGCWTSNERPKKGDLLLWKVKAFSNATKQQQLLLHTIIVVYDSISSPNSLITVVSLYPQPKLLCDHIL